MLLEWLHAARPLSGAAGLIVFVLFLWFSRGGVSAAHLPWFVFAGAYCAYLAIRREE